MDADYVFDPEQPEILSFAALLKAARKPSLEESHAAIADCFGIIRPDGLPRAGEAAGWNHDDWVDNLTRYGFEQPDRTKHQFSFVHRRMPGWRIGLSTSPGDIRAWMNSATQCKRDLRKGLEVIRTHVDMVEHKVPGFFAQLENSVNIFRHNHGQETWNDALFAVMNCFLHRDNLADLGALNGLDVDLDPEEIHAFVLQRGKDRTKISRQTQTLSWHRQEVDKMVKQLNREFGLGLERVVKELDFPAPQSELLLEALKYPTIVSQEEELYLQVRELLDLYRAEAKAEKKSKRMKKSRPISRDELPTTKAPEPKPDPDQPPEPVVQTPEEPAVTQSSEDSDETYQGIQEPDSEGDYIALTEIADLFERPFETVRGWCRRHEIPIFNIAEGDNYLLAVEDSYFNQLEEINQNATRRKVNRVRPHHKNRSAVKPVEVLSPGEAQTSDAEAVTVVKLTPEAKAVCLLLGRDQQELVHLIVEKRFRELAEQVRKAIEL